MYILYAIDDFSFKSELGMQRWAFFTCNNYLQTHNLPVLCQICERQWLESCLIGSLLLLNHAYDHAGWWFQSL